ncbi:RTA1 like protein-domain-containing protein [Apiospora kogelbergensis]|uniref:RTA1 like protein-domain-containing protein n=1 Tax=Apiospora kogelbergensis TaxID=1337665 RepID=UPI0031328451
MADPNVPDPDAFFALYRYRPSAVAAAVACGAFAVVTALHLRRMLKARTFYFTPFVIGGIFEVVGYVGRIWSHNDLSSVLGYSMQQLFILLAPALMVASIYMILGRMIRVLGADHHSIVPLRFLTKIFVAGDVVSFIAQGGGGGIQAAGSLELFELGEKIMVVGLFIQIVFFGFFMVVTVIFDFRLSNRPTDPVLQGIIPWRRYLITLYTTSLIIMARSIFRVIEYVQGNNCYIIRREYLLYIFETSLMFLVMFVFLVQYIDGLAARLDATKLEEDSIDLVEVR